MIIGGLPKLNHENVLLRECMSQGYTTISKGINFLILKTATSKIFTLFLENMDVYNRFIEKNPVLWRNYYILMKLNWMILVIGYE